MVEREHLYEAFISRSALLRPPAVVCLADGCVRRSLGGPNKKGVLARSDARPLTDPLRSNSSPEHCVSADWVEREESVLLHDV